MRSLRKEVFVCLDCESTGLDPKNDRVIEIAAALFSYDEIIEKFETLIDPESQIPESSQEIHKINQQMVEGKPKIAEVLPGFLKMIEGKILVGHGVNFDISLIAAEAYRHQIPTTIEKQPFFDTLRMARIYGESPINSLQHLRQHFNIAAEGAHRAMNDVIVNIEVFKQLGKPYETVEALQDLLQRPIRLKTMPLGKHKGRKFEEIPIEYLYWAEKKDFDQDLLYSIRCEIKNRKKGGGFAVTANPFSNLSN